MDLGNGQHLTYCLNIHSGEAWSDQVAAIKEHAATVRDMIAPGKPFGLGLRIGKQAADGLEAPGVMEAFKQLLTEENMYVLTINGFPYGAFHDTHIKEQVYKPDWRHYERMEYSRMLADLLADTIAPGETRCISTVPVGYRSSMRNDADVTLAICHLSRTAEYLAMIEEHTGKHIVLALEPEPDCLLDDAESTLRFFTECLRPEGAHYLAKKSECPDEEAARILRRHIGVCLDTCHALTLFESPEHVLRQLLDADITVPKVQLSASIQSRITPETRVRLEDFADEVYLHQTCEKTPDGTTVRHPDLPAALEHGRDGSELRIHTHVPLHYDGGNGPASTAPELSSSFFSLVREAGIPVVEIETYTFDILPGQVREGGVDDSIAAEYRWFLQQWNGESA